MISQTHLDGNPILDEIQKASDALGSAFSETLLEMNFCVFTLYTSVLPAILEELGQSILPQSNTSGLAWNYLDAACSGIVGLSQILDENTHRPITTKTKGLINLCSTGQLIAFTTLGLGPLSFAAAFGASFALSLDECGRALRRSSDNQQYWLTDSLSLLEKSYQIRDQLEVDITQLELQTRGNIAEWALNQKKKRWDRLIADIETLEKDILFRFAARKFLQIEDSPSKPISLSNLAILCFLKTRSTDFQNSPFITELNKIHESNPQSDFSTLKPEWQAEFNQAKSPNFREKRDKIIQKKCSTDLQSAIKDSLIWGIAFTGTLLICIPGAQLAGFILMALASTLYLIKNASKLKKQCRSAYHHFFKPEANQDSYSTLNISPTLKAA